VIAVAASPWALGLAIAGTTPAASSVVRTVATAPEPPMFRLVNVKSPTTSGGTVRSLGELGVVDALDEVLARGVKVLEDKLDPLPEWADLETRPSPSVRRLADEVRTYLSEACLRPDRIVPSADGEISYYFFVEEDADGSPVKYASVTCTNDDELVLLLVDKPQGMTDAIEFSTEPSSMRDALVKLAEFVAPCAAQ
jgi:hypothetical protein